MSTRSYSPLGSIPRDAMAAVDSCILADVPSPSRAALSSSSSGTFAPAPADFLSRFAVVAHSPVLVPLPARAILKRHTDTARGSSVKRLCTCGELQRTKLEVPIIGSRASPHRTDIEGELCTWASAQGFWYLAICLNFCRG